MDRDFKRPPHMKKVFLSEFTQNEEANKILLGTKDAKLIHYVTRGENEVWDDLMNLRSELKK